MSLGPLLYFVVFASLASVVFAVNGSLLYLSALDWYEREGRVEDIAKGSVVLGILGGFVLSAILLVSNAPDMVYVYWELVLAAFILSLMVLYPYISWVRKKIYSHFYVAAYVAYNIAMWFIFPAFFYVVMGLGRNETIVASYLMGVILGTLLASAIIREIKVREVILGSLPAVTTAITVADFSSRALSTILPKLIVLGPITINAVHVFLVVSLMVQYFYYRHITGE